MESLFHGGEMLPPQGPAVDSEATYCVTSVGLGSESAKASDKLAREKWTGCFSTQSETQRDGQP